VKKASNNLTNRKAKREGRKSRVHKKPKGMCVRKEFISL